MFLGGVQNNITSKDFMCCVFALFERQNFNLLIEGFIHSLIVLWSVFT